MCCCWCRLAAIDGARPLINDDVIPFPSEADSLPLPLPAKCNRLSLWWDEPRNENNFFMSIYVTSFSIISYYSYLRLISNMLYVLYLYLRGPSLNDVRHEERGSEYHPVQYSNGWKLHGHQLIRFSNKIQKLNNLSGFQMVKRYPNFDRLDCFEYKTILLLYKTDSAS